MKGPHGYIVAPLWLILSILGASVYGVLNDQITVSLSPEYFSVFKRHEFWWLLSWCNLTNAPTRIQAILVGVAATWWFGLFLGVILAGAGLLGKRLRLKTSGLLRAIGLTMAVTLGCSLVFGAAAYLFEPSIAPNATDWPFLEGIKDIRDAFAIGWWHNGAYLGALIGTIIASLAAWRWRGKASGDS